MGQKYPDKGVRDTGRMKTPPYVNRDYTDRRTHITGMTPEEYFQHALEQAIVKCYDLAVDHAESADDFEGFLASQPAPSLAYAAQLGRDGNRAVAAAYLAVGGYDDPILHAKFGLNWLGIDE